MMKAKSTKRALLMSALALLCCVSMFVGTTFAWFTDSVTSGKNTIQSGNLDVELYYSKTANGPWDKVTATTDVFGYDNWEPGHTRVAYFKVANEGSLALKYQLTADVYDEQPGINKDGETFWLSDSLYTKVVEADATREAILAATDGVKLKSSVAMSGERSLLKGTSEVIGLAIWMPTTVGNEANHDGTNVPKIDFGINLIATQFTKESDSFDEKYDEGATYLNQDASGAWLINNVNELYYFASQVNGGNTYDGETVKLTADIDLAGRAWAPIGRPATTTTDFSRSFRGTFDGQGHTVSNLKVNNMGWAGLFGLAYKATIKNVTVKGVALDSSRMTGAVVGQLYGSLENCHVIDANIVLVPNEVDGGYDNGDKVGGIVGWLGDNGNNHYIKGCTAKNVTIKGYRDIGGIAGYIASSTTVENCAVDTITITVDQVTNHYANKDANAGGVVGRRNGTVTVQNNAEANVMIGTTAAASDDATLDAAIRGGATTVILGSGNYIIPDSAQGKTLTIVGNGDTVVATQDDGSYEGCDYSLDGATVTFENITINTDSSTYTGYARCKGTYNNCTINGAYTLYGESVFNNCTFNVVGDAYNIWTWGAKTVKFNECTFNTDGKSILVYNQSCDVYVDGCTFNDRTNGTGFTKSAFETGVDGVGPKYNIYINGTTVNGFAENDQCVGYINIVGNKNSMTNEYLNVVVDGVDVY